jgi:hypothetical protein
MEKKPLPTSAQASQIDLWIKKKQAELEAITAHV